MTTSTATVLVIGSTGQVGRVVVDEALGRGMTVRAQTRSARRASRSLPSGQERLSVVEADPTNTQALRTLVDGVDVVVLTHGGDSDVENNYYAVIPALLEALKDRPQVHVSFMTAMSVSHPSGQRWDWKRRAERLLRASGQPYTIVRPGWFDYQGPRDTQIDLRQGDHVTGQPGVDRRHIAHVLLEGALVPSGRSRTVEIFSRPGAPVGDFEALFAATQADTESGRGALDDDFVPVTDEPLRVQEDLARISARRA